MAQGPNSSVLPYQLAPFGTILEGEWVEVMKVIPDCFVAMKSDCNRISAPIKVDAIENKP